MRAPFVLFTGCLLSCAAAGETAGPAAAADRAIQVQIRAEPAQAMFRSQLLGELDHPVGDRIAIGGLAIPARLDAKGNLELDVGNDGKHKAFTKTGKVALELPIADSKRSFKLQLYVSRRDDGAWVYRNATQLTMQIGQDLFAVVDANGDGTYNQAGIDGMTLAGHEWLFPLPDPAERWCTPGLDLTGLAFGPLGDAPAAMGRVLATTRAEALPVLLGVNRERLKLGLTPRPEDVGLSADAQAHCAYMAQNGILTHPEDSSKPGYTKAGHESGMRSILSMGTAADNVATMMVTTFWHRQDVIRPETLGFGVGYAGAYAAIDGRSAMGKAVASWWPVLCPVPDQRDIPTVYTHESPDPTPGDAEAGYPITAYFGKGRPVLTSHSLVPLIGGKAGAPLDCYVFDAKTPAGSLAGYQRCVAILAKDALLPATIYQVTLAADVDGAAWTRTWRFATVGFNAKARK